MAGEPRRAGNILAEYRAMEVYHSPTSYCAWVCVICTEDRSPFVVFFIEILGNPELYYN
jgi:hypothetical protein